jgi:hypothetical protein
MEEYRNVQNLDMLSFACANMLAEKFSIRLTEENMRALVQDISQEVINEYENIQLRVKELNNITLSKIKKLYQQQQVPSPSKKSPLLTKERSFTQIDVLDDDTITYKLKELEAKRKIIPTVHAAHTTHPTQSHSSHMTHTESILDVPIPLSASSSSSSQGTAFQHNPISITLPSNMNEKILYKNFIINSLNRDWEKSPARNSIKFNIAFDLQNNTFYPQCICFPKFVKNITPYALMNITDSAKSLFYSFTCHSSSVGGKWDLWYPVEDVENIALQNKSWSIKFYDFTNNELDLGTDSIKVVEARKVDGNKFSLKIELDSDSYDNCFHVNDIVCIKIYNGKTYLKKITAYEKGNINIMTIIDDKNELVLEDFINSKIMNTNNQYSIIIKYHYNK